MLVRPVEAAQAPLLAQPYYRDGQAGPLVTSLAHVPEALEVTLPFVGAVLGPSAIDARTKELAILRASARMECSYCVQTHSVVALDSGVSVVEVRALCDVGEGLKTFPDGAERALLAWVDVVVGGVGDVPAAASAALAEHYSEAEIVELTLVCAATLMLNRYCTALALPAGAETLRRLSAEGLR